MTIPDRWIVDLQLVGKVVHLELRPGVEPPDVGTVLITERYGAWKTLAVVQLASVWRGTTLAVKLVGSGAQTTGAQTVATQTTATQTISA